MNRFVWFFAVVLLSVSGPAAIQAQISEVSLYDAVARAAADRMGTERVTIDRMLNPGLVQSAGRLELHPDVEGDLESLGHRVVDVNPRLVCPPDGPRPKCALPEDTPVVVRLGPVTVDGDGKYAMIVKLMEASGSSRQPISYETHRVALNRSGEGAWEVGEWTLISIT